MIIKVVVKACEVSCDFPRIAMVGDDAFWDEDFALQFVKGACLHVVADWKKVPDRIEFEVIREVKS